MMQGVVLRFEEADHLRQYLDDLNEDGKHPVAAGMHGDGWPFLITLVGPYADSEDVFFDSPWQSDVDWGEMADGVWTPHQPRCGECQAQAHLLKDLKFPVVVFATEDFVQPLGQHSKACRDFGDDANCNRCQM